MENFFSFIDIQQLILVKLCFFVFLVCGIISVYRTWPPSVFLFGMGAISGLAYFFLAENTLLMFWGLRADEQTIGAMYEMFAHGSVFSDFAYAHLPPFYPPLWFQIFGLIGRMMDWNGVQIAKSASLVTITAFPILLYGVQRWYWKNTRASALNKAAADQENKNFNSREDDTPEQSNMYPRMTAWMLGVIFLFITIDWDAIITKPYEFFSAALTVLWSVFLLHDVHEHRMTWKRAAVYGIAGGILFLIFYFWFFLAAIGIALFHVCCHKKVTARMYAWFASVGAIMLIVASPFWLPLAKTYASLGSENWQLGFFVLDWIGTHGQIFSDWTIGGIIGMAGLISLVVFRKNGYMRGLLSLFAAPYVWQVMGMLAIYFFASPLQESKGFFFFNRAILAFAAAYGAERAWFWYCETYAKTSEHRRMWQSTVGVLGVLFLAPQLLFGTFADNPDVQNVRVRANEIRPGLLELAGYLNSRGDIANTVALTSGVPELHSFVPLNEFVYFNQHNSHPAALFSERVLLVEDMSRAKTSSVLYDTIHRTRFSPPVLFIFYKGFDGVYRIFFQTDDFPNRMKEKTIDIPKALFEDARFDRVYENGHFVVFQ